MVEISYCDELPDPEAYLALFESTGWNAVYRLDQVELFATLAASWTMLCAYHNEQLVGFGRIISDGKLHAFLVELIVLPAYQGQGIGSALTKRLLARCQAQGIREVQLFCAKGKINFYERHGFSVRPNDAPGMQRRLC